MQRGKKNQTKHFKRRTKQSRKEQETNKGKRQQTLGEETKESGTALNRKKKIPMKDVALLLKELEMRNGELICYFMIH